jgi:hypothetical protein
MFISDFHSPYKSQIFIFLASLFLFPAIIFYKTLYFYQATNTLKSEKMNSDSDFDMVSIELVS